jgi:guanylate kinase
MTTPAHNLRLLAFIGPSGCGKSSLLRELIDRGLVSVSPTWTDRPRRAGEETLEHEFVSATEFDQLVAAGHFAEVVQPFNLPYRYGLPLITTADTSTIVMIRAPFVKLFRHYYPAAQVYQLEASYDFAARAVADRNEADAGTRLSGFEQEVAAGRQLADRIFYNQAQPLAELADEVIAAMTADKLL